VATKVLGLVGTFAVIAFFYWLFPEYRQDFFNPYWKSLGMGMPILILFSFYYFVEVDIRMQKPEDGYWHMGQLMLFNFGAVNKRVLAEHYRSWIIKAFFLPLMYVYMINDFNYLIHFDYKFDDFFKTYDFFYNLIFTVDVAFASAGYMMTFRYMDWHIRSAEPTMLGWFVALACYSPFWNSVFYGSYFGYNNQYYWGDLVRQYPALQILWGCTILFLVAVYSIATVALGCRFSNLTYRGLVTNGPYRFTKHPAYVTKNLSWWLVSVPFVITTDWQMAFRQSVMLLGVNFIYYMRARTEENHLSNYPDYVTYANWINEHGILRFVGNLIPYFKYSEKRAKESGSVVWWKRVEGMDGY
jgi:protein-S-isoprenylcysteine O-methyltransferase Ste14